MWNQIDYLEGRNANYPDYSRPEHARGYQDAQMEHQRALHRQQDEGPPKPDPMVDGLGSVAVIKVIAVLVLFVIAIVLVALAWLIASLAPILVGALLLQQWVEKERKTTIPAAFAVSLATTLLVIGALYAPTFVFGDSLLVRIAGAALAIVVAIASGWLVRRWVGRVSVATSALAAVLILSTVCGVFGVVYGALRFDLTGRVLKAVLPRQLEPASAPFTLPPHHWLANTFVEVGRKSMWEEWSRKQASGKNAVPKKAK